MDLKTVKLPSGAELKLHAAPFADSKALLQAVLEESKGLRLDGNSDIDVNLWKDLVCVGFSSKKIEACLAKCMERALVDGQRIDDKTFEPLERRDDYMSVCYEVAKENLLPFTKSLYAQYSQVLGAVIKSSPA